MQGSRRSCSIWATPVLAPKTKKGVQDGDGRGFVVGWGAFHEMKVASQNSVPRSLISSALLSALAPSLSFKLSVLRGVYWNTCAG